MFLNLSNHPSNEWSAEQREAALALSQALNEGYDDFTVDIDDMPFPNIPPTASTQEVANLASNYARRISNDYIHQLTVVHVMGEMTFVTAVVNALHKRGFDCVASTTERQTIEHPDGSKTSQFKFVQFRHYVNL